MKGIEEGRRMLREEVDDFTFPSGDCEIERDLGVQCLFLGKGNDVRSDDVRDTNALGGIFADEDELAVGDVEHTPVEQGELVDRGRSVSEITGTEAKTERSDNRNRDRRPRKSRPGSHLSVFQKPYTDSAVAGLASFERNWGCESFERLGG